MDRSKLRADQAADQADVSIEDVKSDLETDGFTLDEASQAELHNLLTDFIFKHAKPLKRK